MGTHEVAIISQLWNKSFDGSIVKFVGSEKFDEWIKKMCVALTEIESGLGTPNRNDERSFYRSKIMGILFARALHCNNTLTRTNSMWDEQYQHLIDSVPQLTLSDCFYATYHFGLVPEFIEFLLEMQADARSFIWDKLIHWIKDLLREDEMASSFILATSLLISLGLLLSEKQHENEPFSETLELIFNEILERRSSNLEIKPFLAENSTCLQMMVRKLHIFKEHLAKRSQPVTATPDVFHLDSLFRTLTSNAIENIGKDCTGRDDADLLNKLIEGNHAGNDTVKDSLVFVLEELFGDCIDLALRCSSLFHGQVILDLSEILSSIRSENCQILIHLVSGNVDLETTDDKNFTLDRMIYTIEHHLCNYDICLEKLLNQIIEDPLSNDMWKDAFECLGRCPECLAKTETLFFVLKGISKCIKKCDPQSATNSIFIACKLQETFWSGYKLLSLSSKTKATKLIISDRDLYKLLSEYPLKKYENDPSKLRHFYQTRDLEVKSFFDSLVSENSASDQVLEKVCEICIMQPKAMIQRLVDQAVKNALQIEILIDILGRFSCLLELKNVKSKRSVIWTYFFKILTTYCQNDEVIFAENGLNFFKKLIFKVVDKPSNQKTYLTFLEEMYEDLVVSFSSNQAKNSLMRKLQLKLLDCVINAGLFYQEVTVSKLLVLCVSLGANIDRSRHFWNSNFDFDHEEHEILVELFECLIEIVDEHLKTESGTVQNQFVEWVAHSITSFAWTTQLRFLLILSSNAHCRVQVPSSLSEICSIPDTLECSEDVSYGPGTGLLAWHQCFIINPSICPLASLDVKNLSPEEVKLFTDGWILTLAQVLPFCLSHEWNRLLEASKVLLLDSLLHVPVASRYVISLPDIDLCDCSIVLGIVWILVRVSELLAKECFIGWTSPKMWLHFSKCYSSYISKLINDSAEFGRAVADSQLFMLSQMFCCVCGFIRLLSELPPDKKHPNTEENVFILTLEIAGSFEKLYQKVTDKYMHGDTNEVTITDFADDSFSDKSSQLEMPDRSHLQLTLNMSERLNEMMQAASFVPIQEYQDTLKQKLSSVLQPTEG